jgi:N-acetylglucosamine kinase-like BadF-type ATPase
LLGVDGGNTKTIAIVATADGTIVGAGRAGCSDIYNSENESAAFDAVCCAVREALAGADGSALDILAGAFSMAGADWPEDIALLEQVVAACGYGRRTRVVNDAIGALRAGTPDGVGVVIACGTGVAIGGRNAQGAVWYSGNWPTAPGGAELGRQALLAVYDAHLDLGPPTALTGAILSSFGVTTVDEILHRTTARETRWSLNDHAPLAPILFDQAMQGDEVACDLVRRAGTRQADVALVAADALGFGARPFRLVLSGGVLRHPSRLLERTICERLESLRPQVEIVLAPPEPAVGAVLLAMDLAGIASDEQTRARLVTTLPRPDFFQTCERAAE